MLYAAVSSADAGSRKKSAYVGEVSRSAAAEPVEG